MTSYRIYILPTRSWTVLLLVLAAMWYAAISQGNGAAYVLMFFLGSLVMVSAIHAHFALVGLKLRVGQITAVFAGESAHVAVEVSNPTRRSRSSLAVAPRGYVFKDDKHAALRNLEPDALETAELTVPTQHRGRLALGRLALTTIYPLGFFRSWSYHPTDASCLVYPTPTGHLPLPGGTSEDINVLAGVGTGGDDYAGARPYQTGESQRHVDWRAVARGQPLLIKQFSGAGSRRLWLEYRDVAALTDVETRLSQLAQWIVDAERDGFAYGLRLPGIEFKPSRGNTHYHRCLGALAVFEQSSVGT